MKTVRNYIDEALEILEHRDTDPMAIPGVFERLWDAKVALDNSREVTEKVTTGWASDAGPDARSAFTVVTYKARVVLDD